MRFDGTDVQPFLPGGTYEELDPIDYASVSPDSSTLAFIALTEETFYFYGELHLLDIASGEITTLTSNSDGGNGYPTWSPDGTQLLYLSGGVNDAYGEVYIYDLAADEHRFVTDSFIRRADSSILTVGSILNVDWSPEGERLVLSLQVPVGEELQTDNILVVMDADGSNPQIVTPRHMVFKEPLWSSDSNIIFGDCYDDGEDHDYICQVNLQTGEVEKLIAIDHTTTPIELNRSLFINEMRGLPNGQIIFQTGSPDVYLYDQQAGTIIRISDSSVDNSVEILGWVDLSLLPE